MSNSWINPQTIVAFVTLGVITWYTFETRRLRKASSKQTALVQKQIDLSLRPCIILYRAPQSSILLKNVGHGPALQVSVFSIKTESYIYEFEKFYLLEPGEAGLSFNVAQYRNTPTKEMVTGAATIWDIGEGAILEARYFNLEGTEYFSKILIRKIDWTISLIKTGTFNRGEARGPGSDSDDR